MYQMAVAHFFRYKKLGKWWIRRNRTINSWVKLVIKPRAWSIAMFNYQRIELIRPTEGGYNLI